MEQAVLGEDGSSISEPLDPEDETLIRSAGTFLDPSLTVRRLEDKKFNVSSRRRQNSLL